MIPGPVPGVYFKMCEQRAMSRGRGNLVLEGEDARSLAGLYKSSGRDSFFGKTLDDTACTPLALGVQNAEGCGVRAATFNANNATPDEPVGCIVVGDDAGLQYRIGAQGFSLFSSLQRVCARFLARLPLPKKSTQQRETLQKMAHSFA